jgi:transposase InsO family protein
MDFVEKLPDSNGFDSILVVVDRSSKQAILIPTTTSATSAEVARLFLIHVFSKHGVPSHVTSDRGSEFVSLFTRSLGEILGMKLHFTSGYHPEADGQTERTNQTIEAYIRMYCSFQQDDWSEWLLLAEFAYNNSPSASTDISLFFANKGYHPSIGVDLNRDVPSAKAAAYAADIQKVHQYLRETLSDAREKMKETTDRR